MKHECNPIPKVITSAERITESLEALMEMQRQQQKTIADILTAISANTAAIAGLEQRIIENDRRIAELRVRVL